MPVPLSVTNPKAKGLAAQVAAELPTEGPFARLQAEQQPAAAAATPGERSGADGAAAQQQPHVQQQQQQQQLAPHLLHHQLAPLKLKGQLGDGLRRGLAARLRQPRKVRIRQRLLCGSDQQHHTGNRLQVAACALGIPSTASRLHCKPR